MREERTSADGREMRAATSVQLIIVWRGSKFLLASLAPQTHRSRNRTCSPRTIRFRLAARSLELRGS